jgi:hypothetical protein
MQTHGNSRFLFLGLAVLAACSASAGNKPGHDPSASANGGSSTSGGGGQTSGGSLIIEPTGGDGPNPVSDPYPNPWQYYDEGSERAFKDPSLGDDVKDLFDGATAASGAPAIVYPLEGSMHPMNLVHITLQWSRGSTSNSLFRIDASAGQELYRFFVPCTTAECTYVMPEAEWYHLGLDQAGQQVELSIAGTDGEHGAVATSAPLSIAFSPEPVMGAVYYWAAAGNQIKRANFGSAKAVPYVAPNSETNEFGCVGCHSVSRDGKVIAFAVSELAGENAAAIQVAPTEDPAAPYVKPTKGTSPFPADMLGGNTVSPTDHFGQNVALSPDGALAAINGRPLDPGNGYWPPYFEIREAQSGTTLETHKMGDALFGDHRLPILPEWSPDGTQIAATLASDDVKDCLYSFFTCKSSIAILPYDGQLGAAQVLVDNPDPSIYHYYPTWSPDGEWIAFVSAKYDASKPNVRSQTNPNGVLRMVRSTGGPYTCPSADCIELTNGTRYTWSDAMLSQGRYSSWPKFTPFAQADGSLFFVSFNTRVDYGFLAKEKTQIWMFAVDTAKVGSGDPSSAPIWLPYQEIEDESLTPYWTEDLPCQADPAGGCSGCVAGESCVVNADNRCYCKTTVK